MHAIQQTGIPGERGDTIDQSGTYYLQIELQTDLDETFQSNVIQIRIVEPEGVDAKVWELLRSEDGTHQDYCFLIGGGAIKTEEMVRKFVSIVQSHPNSLYGPALRKGLIHYFENQLSRARLSEEEKAMYEAIRPEP